MMSPYRAAVIGAGQMGAGKDPGFISHASAFKQHPHYELVGICDPHLAALRSAEKHWQVQGYQEIAPLLEAAQPDIISICSPDDYHAKHLTLIAAYGPKAIILEKPANINYSLVESLQAQKSLVAVNYTRRYLPIYHQLRTLLSEQIIRAISIRYAKGLIHNGSHAIDLIRLLVGEITQYHILSVHDDYLATDPSVSLHLQTKQCSNIILQALNQQDYVHFEVDIFTNTHRYHIHSDHQILSIYSVKDRQGIPPGKRLVLLQEQKIEHQHALILLLNKVANQLAGKTTAIFDLTEAFKTETLTQAISAQALKLNTMSHANTSDI